MSTMTQTVVIAEMQGRDLLRRRGVVILFVLLPAAFYYSMPANENFSLSPGSMGVSWAVAAAGLLGILGWRRADPRLALAGARAYQGLLGRLLLLLGLSFGLVAIFTPQILWRSSGLLDDPALMTLALVLMAVVSAPLGLATGALVPRELEGALVLIGVAGVGISVPPDTGVAMLLPLWGPLEIMQIAAGGKDAGVGAGLAHTSVSAVFLLAVAYWFWHRRTRIHS